MHENSYVEKEINSAVPDDFKRIVGIKSGIERRLHTAGIVSYQQLASLSPSELMDILGNLVGLTPDRIIKQDWAGQALALASDNAAMQPAGSPEETVIASNPSDRQHYQLFTLELLMNESNDVRRTRLVHVASNCENTWAGWDADRLIHSISELASLDLPQPALQPIEAQPEEEKDTFPDPIETKRKEPSWVKNTDFMLSDAYTRSPISGEGKNLFLQEQAVHSQFKVNLNAEKTDAQTPLYYQADVYIHRLDQPEKRLSKSLKGTLVSGSTSLVEYDSENLSPGVYRFVTKVCISDDVAEPSVALDPDQVGTVSSNIFWVYA